MRMLMWERLPPLRTIVDHYHLNADKKLGQHFLFDRNLTDKIVRSAGDLAGKTVLEIGPGPGGLTRSILDAKPEKLIVIERDRRCVHALNESLKPLAGETLEIIEADALAVDYLTLVPTGTRIIANLPYNIGTELLLRWLKEPTHFASLTLMFQKEVVERIVSPEDESAYGRLAILCQWLCLCFKLFDIPPQAFTPPPRVVSAVAHLVPRPNPAYPAPRLMLERLTHTLFSARRKMIRAGLKPLVSDPLAVLAACKIDPTSRPETLSVETFCRLATYLEDQGLGGG